MRFHKGSDKAWSGWEPGAWSEEILLHPSANSWLSHHFKDEFFRKYGNYIAIPIGMGNVVKKNKPLFGSCSYFTMFLNILIS